MAHPGGLEFSGSKSEVQTVALGHKLDPDPTHNPVNIGLPNPKLVIVRCGMVEEVTKLQVWVVADIRRILEQFGRRGFEPCGDDVLSHAIRSDGPHFPIGNLAYIAFGQLHECARSDTCHTSRRNKLTSLGTGLSEDKRLKGVIVIGEGDRACTLMAEAELPAEGGPCLASRERALRAPDFDADDGVASRDWTSGVRSSDAYDNFTSREGVATEGVRGAGDDSGVAD